MSLIWFLAVTTAFALEGFLLSGEPVFLFEAFASTGLLLFSAHYFEMT